MEEKPLQVLLIEDNPGDFRLIQEMFKKSRANVELKWAKQLSTGLANLKEEIFDGLLVDLGLPDSQGIDTFKKIHDQAPQIPIIVLTGLADDGLALRAVREGAQDYLIKGQTDSNLLIRTIHYAIERKRAEEETRLHENRLKNLLDLHRMGDATEKEIFDFTLEAGLRTVPSEFAFVGIISADEAVMIIHAWSRGAMGQCANTEKPIHFPIAEAGLWGEIVRQRRPIIVNDYNTSTEFKKGYPEGHVPIKRFLGIPIFSADRIVAVAAVANKVSEYTESDVSSLTSLLHEMWNLIDRKQAEEALKKSEEKYRTILENIEDGYFEVDIAGNFTFFNGSLCQILGYSRDEMMGMNNRQYTDNENAPKLYQAFNKVYRTGGPAKGFDWEIIRKDGIKRYIEASVSLIKDSSGQPIGFRGIVLDITERKQVEESLRESEKRYRQVIENATEIIYSLNTKGNFTYGNPAGLKVTGYSLADLRSFNYADLVLPEHRERVMEIYINQFSQRIPTTHVEFPFFSKAGKIIWFSQNSSLVIEDEKVVGFHMIARDITERKQAEEALQESEEKYRLLVENANEAIFVIQDGMLRFFNIKNIELIGYSKEELTSTPFINFVHPDDREVTLGRYLKRVRGEELPGVNVFRIIDKAGNIKWAEVNSVFISWEGRPATLNFLNDITERKLAEEALRESEERYRTILDNIEDGYFEVDIAGSFTFFNDSLCRILGYSRDETMGMNNKQYMDKENTKKVYQTFNQVYTTGEPQISFDWEIIRKDCTKRFIESSVSLIRNSKSEQIGFRGVVRDVTERKRAEEVLRENEEKFRELFDNAPVGYHEFDIEGRITSVNRTELEMLGYTLEERIGQFVWSFIAEEEKSRQTVLGKLAGVIPPSRSLERTYRRKDGTIFPVLIQDQLLRDPEGKIIGIRSTIQDISEPKRAEQEMAVLQDQLRQSQKIEAIGSLSGGIAHDFNNILTTISGNAQLSLLDLKQGDPLRGNIEEIRKASERAADLTRQLLAFSRKQVMEMQVLDLNLIVKGLDKMLHRLLGEDIDLVTVLPEGIGNVKADPGQIEQVVVNLAVNARDAMIEGGKLTIETADVELDEEYARKHIAVIPGRYVMLSVSDTGVGMTSEVKDRIFEPFFTTKEQGKGTGLGLSTVYGIVKQSGGNIWVYSEPGQGTTFKIYLPQVDEPLTEEKQEVVKEIPRGNETILVVEDEETVRKLAIRLLKRQGYRVLEASDGGKALLLCEKFKERIHLILTDVVMPGMSGRKLAERLKQIHPEMKVLYMSGYTDNAIVHHGVLEEGINFMQKPFTVDGLARKVREVLDH